MNIELTEEEYDILLLETKVEYNKTIKYLKQARQCLLDGMDDDPTEYSPTSAVVRIDDAIGYIATAIYNMDEVYD